MNVSSNWIWNVPGGATGDGPINMGSTVSSVILSPNVLSAPAAGAWEACVP
jgi:hypothetical protein